MPNLGNDVNVCLIQQHSDSVMFLTSKSYGFDFLLYNCYFRKKNITALLSVVEQYWSVSWRGGGHLIGLSNHFLRRLALQKVSYCPCYFTLS